VGALIALFERTVGLYASLVDVNAYDQPGVEAGKEAAAGILAVQRRLEAALGGAPRTAEELAEAMAEPEVETVYLLLEHLAANGRARRTGEGPREARFAGAVGRPGSPG
jgi:glucose-6-phosphate isomerase